MPSLHPTPAARPQAPATPDKAGLEVSRPWRALGATLAVMVTSLLLAVIHGLAEPQPGATLAQVHSPATPNPAARGAMPGDVTLGAQELYIHPVNG